MHWYQNECVRHYQARLRAMEASRGPRARSEVTDLTLQCLLYLYLDMLTHKYMGWTIPYLFNNWCNSVSFQALYESRGFGSPDYRRWWKRKRSILEKCFQFQMKMKILVTNTYKKKKDQWRLITKLPTPIFCVQLEHRNQHGKTEQASDQRHFGEHLGSLECLLNIEDRWTAWNVYLTLECS